MTFNLRGAIARLACFAACAAMFVSLVGQRTVVAAPNLVANGSFESPNIGGGFIKLTGIDVTSLPGWVVDDAGTSIDHINNFWMAADGVQSVDMNGVIAGTIYQDIPTVAGQSYRIRFALAGNIEGVDDKELEVLWEGGQVADVIFDQSPGFNPFFMGWEYHEIMATAVDSSTRLTFHSLTGAMNGAGGFEPWYGPALDDVSVSAIPEPGALMLLLLGLLGSMTVRRR